MSPQLKRAVAEKVILFLHPDVQQLKDYLSLISSHLSADYLLATAHSAELARTILEQHVAAENQIMLTIGSDEIKGYDAIDLMNMIHRISPDTKQIMVLSKPNAKTDLFEKGPFHLVRCLTFPFDESDFVMSIKMLIQLAEQEQELGKLRVSHTQMEHEMEQRIEAGIQNSTHRKQFLEALVKARLNYLNDIINVLDKNEHYLDDIIDFFESLKTQMSPKEKSKMSPGFYEIRNGILELSDWNKNIDSTFIVNATDFNVKYIFGLEIQKMEKQFKDKHQSLLENINSEVRVKADYHMILSTIQSILKVLNYISPERSKITLLSKLNGTYVDIYIQNNGDTYELDQLQALLQTTSDETVPDNSSILTDQFLNWSVIKEFVALNDGSVRISKVKDATQFILSLQASKMYLTMLSAIKNSQPLYNLKHLRVLLVDDTDINLMIMLKQLTQYGLSITTCSNGFEAIQQAQKQKFEFIFMDLVMPKLDGYAAAKIIMEHQLSLGNTPKIIFQTSHQKMISKAKMKDAGGDRIILKPLKTNILEDILWDHLKMATPLRENE